MKGSGEPEGFHTNAAFWLVLRVGLAYISKQCSQFLKANIAWLWIQEFGSFKTKTSVAETDLGEQRAQLHGTTPSSDFFVCLLLLPRFAVAIHNNGINSSLLRVQSTLSPIASSLPGTMTLPFITALHVFSFYLSLPSSQLSVRRSKLGIGKLFFMQWPHWPPTPTPQQEPSS